MAKGTLSLSDTDALRRRNHELSILNAIARALNSSVELDQALQTGLSQVAHWLGLAAPRGDRQNLPGRLAKSPACAAR